MTKAAPPATEAVPTLAVAPPLDEGHRPRRWPTVLGITLAALVVVMIVLPTFFGAKGGPQSRAAQSNLRNGIAAAKVHFTEADVYIGFNAAAGAAIESQLTWVDGDATNVNAVNVNGVSATTVLLETESESGASFCIADDATLGTVRGRDPEGGTFNNYAGCAAAEEW